MGEGERMSQSVAFNDVETQTEPRTLRIRVRTTKIPRGFLDVMYVSEPSKHRLF